MSRSKEMTAYLLVDLEILDRPGYGEYPPKVWPLIEKHGGKLTHRISRFEAVEGDWAPHRMVIIEFPSKTHARAFLDDPDYGPIKAIRMRTAKTLMVLGESE
jgi:uncharacterized protein (DUF1330 family)